jgi:outer membrane protein assembly complex protein YaeT
MFTRRATLEMNDARGGWRSSALLLHLAFFMLRCPTAVTAQTPPPPAPVIAEVRVEQEGQPVTDPQILGLLETTVGKPLSVADVRESIRHLSGLNRYDDVEVYREPAAEGVRVRYVLYPLHPVDRVAFRGTVALDQDDLRRTVTQRFGNAPPAGRVDAVTDLLRATYRDRGYPDAQITPQIEETHNPDRATMWFDIDAGMRANVRSIKYDQADPRDQGALLGLPQLKEGVPYDADAVRKELQRFADGLHARGYYEARASHTVAFSPEGATVTVMLVRGPKVVVAFAGDPLPENERERLVPIRTEGSVDQDLLEDAQNAIIEYLRGRGYRDARVDFVENEQADQLTITFTIQRGARYTVNDVLIRGNTAATTAELQQAVRIKSGEPFVEAAATGGAATIRNLYRSRGFTRAMVQVTPGELPPDAAADAARRIDVTFAVAEGPRTDVRSITYTGNTVMSEAQLRAMTSTTIGRPYSEATVITDRDKIDLDYRNRGYDSVVVEPNVMLADNDTKADVRFTITEGPQVIVDHVIIVGNQRTSAETIERELLLKPGEPLGYSARIESQQRLSALGLFRRVRIDDLQHAGEARRDVMVQVEEAPPTTISYGGGLEVGARLRTDVTGTAVERYEFVPRGSFEIGRRNLWGKNRSVDFFSRVALRSRDLAFTDNGPQLVEPESSLGFNEYRVYGTFREPRVLGTRSDVLLTGIFDQAIRSSFNFRTREARAETGYRFSPRYSIAGRYSIEKTELFDEHISEAEQPLVDKLFPQVRLSKFSGTFIRDTRDDILDPATGKFFITDGEFAARAIGSEVGFVKTYLQAFSYNRLPLQRRVILALGGRLGLAHGFPQLKDGDIVEELPASERFFAGGDTTVRGFTLDRLGNAETITPTGFPKGGNSVVIVNAELRINMTRSLEGVTFVDGGNVFPRASDLDLTDMRGSYGFGVRYKSPIGPLRVDYGIKMHRLALIPGRLERGSVLHISLGQAF